ncbi:hypothetical protein [Pseudomonas sp. HAR-UPW-AIA-41]|uniref:hypothetical protein n=1 Tax=Pseudomonas sp. HAR-UPW-AIA-41 TaxID=1985301 RepID=UPI001142DA02|nr:hypothetical protein [Pseudomonas sp. HAR-UPW-AIA-41]
MPRTLLYLAVAVLASTATVALLLHDSSATNVAAVSPDRLPPAQTNASATGLPPSKPLVMPSAGAAESLASTSFQEVTSSAAAQTDDVIELWDSSSLVPEQQDEMTLYHTRMPVSVLGMLAVGKTLQLAVPGRKEPLRAKLDETHNTGVAVWSGSVQGGQPEDSLTVVRGQVETHITVATRDKTLSFVVDNATGSTLMTDQNELLLRATPDALITPESTPLQPLPPPTRG